MSTSSLLSLKLRFLLFSLLAPRRAAARAIMHTTTILEAARGLEL